MLQHLAGGVCWHPVSERKAKAVCACRGRGGRRRRQGGSVMRRSEACWRPKSKTPQPGAVGAFCRESLAMTYFHTGIRTIIGAESFHGPVRDGKGWYRLAMVTRL